MFMLQLSANGYLLSNAACNHQRIQVYAFEVEVPVALVAFKDS